MASSGRSSTRRGFGKIRQTSSKTRRYQASYADPYVGNAKRHNAPRTFTAKIDAEHWLSDELRLIERGNWTPPAERAEAKARAFDAMFLALGGLAAIIRRVEDVGRHRILRAELAGRPFDVILPEGAPLPPGPARLRATDLRNAVRRDNLTSDERRAEDELRRRDRNNR